MYLLFKATIRRFGLLLYAHQALGQIDPNPRSLLQFGLDQDTAGTGPQAVYGYYYYNNPALTGTNTALRAAIAPVYFDGEIGLRDVFPRTDLGLGINGGAFGENYFEMQRGDYLKSESFFGHGGGATLNLYHRVNPQQKIPLSLVISGGARYSTYSEGFDTDSSFVLPGDRSSALGRVGLRFAGMEPLLYANAALEVSVWVERQWRQDAGVYGFSGDRLVEPTIDRYWLYAGLSLPVPSNRQTLSVALTLGGSARADRFSAWRLGGVLPLASELPLTLPGFYYQEISAKQFAHFNAGYVVPLSTDIRWELRFAAALAYVQYLDPFYQTNPWQSGLGPSISFTSHTEVWRLVLRYGYGLTTLRDGSYGSHSIGLLYQYNFEQRHKRNASPRGN